MYLIHSFCYVTIKHKIFVKSCCLNVLIGQQQRAWTVSHEVHYPLAFSTSGMGKKKKRQMTEAWSRSACGPGKTVPFLFLTRNQEKQWVAITLYLKANGTFAITFVHISSCLFLSLSNFFGGVNVFTQRPKLLLGYFCELWPPAGLFSPLKWSSPGRKEELW